VAVVADLRGVHVRDIMSTDCATVGADMRVQTLVDEHLLRTGQRCFVVGGQGGIIGLITSHEIKGLPRDRWAGAPLSDVMRPIDHLRTVQPDTLAIDALRLMGREDVNQLPVMSEGKFKGMGGRRHVLQLLQARAELNLRATPNAAVPLRVPRAAAAPVS
jgi:CBS domain-containing protein